MENTVLLLCRVTPPPVCLPSDVAHRVKSLIYLLLHVSILIWRHQLKVAYACHSKNKLVVLTTEWLPWLQSSCGYESFTLVTG